MTDYNDCWSEESGGVPSADVKAIHRALKPEHPIAGNMLQCLQMSLLLLMLSMIALELLV
jgi:hypothetical protein